MWMNLWSRLLRKRNTQANDGAYIESLEVRDIRNNAIGVPLSISGNQRRICWASTSSLLEQ